MKQGRKQLKKGGFPEKGQEMTHEKSQGEHPFLP